MHLIPGQVHWMGKEKTQIGFDSLKWWITLWLSNFSDRVYSNTWHLFGLHPWPWLILKPSLTYARLAELRIFYRLSHFFSTFFSIILSDRHTFEKYISHETDENSYKVLKDWRCLTSSCYLFFILFFKHLPHTRQLQHPHMMTATYSALRVMITKYSVPRASNANPDSVKFLEYSE